MKKIFGVGFSLIAAGFAAPAMALDGPFKAAYQASEVDVSHIAGTVDIVAGGPEVSVSISGQPDELKAITVSLSGNVLRIESSRRSHDFFDGATDDAATRSHLQISVPKGTTLVTESLVGKATIGDVGGDLRFSGADVKAKIGAMKSARVSVAGSGDVTLGEVEGALEVSVAGSGDVQTASADSAKVSIAGHGDVHLQTVRHGLEAKISGSGGIDAASVDGAVETSIAGSGAVTIAKGRATPLKVSIMGSGDFALNGEAVDPDISVMGSGTVKLGKITGQLKSRGHADLQVGS